MIDIVNKVSRKPKVAVVQPIFHVGGGNESVASWMLDSLKAEYDLSLITFSDTVSSEMNRYYGTDLKDNDFELVRLKTPRFLAKTGRFSTFKEHLVMRYCKSVKDEHDLFISAGVGMDFGVRSMQYFCYAPATRLTTKSGPVITLAKLVLNVVSRRISGFNIRSLQNNISLVPSEWSAQVTSSAYGLENVTVVYSPVNHPPRKSPWLKRENKFLCVARICPDKRILEVIEIIEKVRAKGYHVELHIVGRSDDDDYHDLVSKAALSKDSWLHLHGLKNRHELSVLMDSCKYGINGLTEEPFGIAVAEMVKSGCIVFVPNGGGQVEIVDNPELIFNDVQDAVSKICAVLNNRKRQSILLDHLQGQAIKFSSEVFKTQIRKEVRQYFENTSHNCS